MRNEAAQPDLQTLWQQQKVEAIEMSVEQLERKARRYQSKIRRRNLLEYLAVAVIIPYMAFVIWKFPQPLIQLAAGLSIAGAVYLAIQLYRRGSAQASPQDRALKPWIEYHRTELRRQRDLLSSSWRWYLGPLIPGLACFVIAGILVNPGRLQHPTAFVSAYAVVAAAAILWVRRWHVRCARKLDRQIGELDAMQKEQA